MFARFFIYRPVFAWVIAIVIMLGGVVALETLPIAQYPDVAPPSISIKATYTGASAETLENSVTQVIEQELTGLDGLLYFSSPAVPMVMPRSSPHLSRGLMLIPRRYRCKIRFSRR